MVKISETVSDKMEELSSELLSFIFDFIPEDSLELRKVCDDWDFVITKYYNITPIRTLGTFREIIDVFYRSKLNIFMIFLLDYIRYIHKLDICNFYKVNMTNLGNVHTLILSNNYSVKDVSDLGDVHTLSLSGCRNVEDVSALSNVHTLKLGGNNIIGFSALGNVHNLYFT